MEAGPNTVVVIGAGPAGIASAIALRDAGLRPLVVDRAEQVGSAWRGRYDRLTLNTVGRFSHLPGRPYPEEVPTFPSRDEVVAHLERHAAEDGIDLLLGTEVECIDRDNGDWLLWTSEGKLRAPQLIVATGHMGAPEIPDWSGLVEFAGELLHSAEYRNPEPYRGRKALVVGAGTSGMEIAHDLAEGGAEKIWLSVRTPPNIMLKEGAAIEALACLLFLLPPRIGDAVTRFGRKQDLGDLSVVGLPVPEDGVFTDLRRRKKVPAIVDEEVVESVKEGRVEVVGAVESLDATGVRLDGGERIEPDAVICATGFRGGLEQLLGRFGVLGEDGWPKVRDGRAAAPGLRFVGYTPRPAQIAYMGREAKRAARQIRREMRRAPATESPEAAPQAEEPAGRSRLIA